MPMRSRTLRPPPASWPRWLCPSCRCWSRACHPPLFVDLATAVPPAAAGAAPGHSGAKPRAVRRSLVTVPIIRRHRALRIGGHRRPILSRCRRGKGCLKAKEAYRPGTPWRQLRARSTRPATSRCSPPWSPRTSTACGASASGVAGPLIIGHAGQGDVLRLAGFLTRNGHPHHTLDPDSDSCAKTLLERFSVAPSELPIVLCPNGQMLRNPSEVELARCIGLVRPIDPSKVYDAAIIGAGPAGLAAAVYAASEGLSVIVLDCRAFGGQAGASARIEN